MILVDTSIWIKATRNKNSAEALELDALISRDEVATTDIVLAEVLQGTANQRAFDEYSETMSGLHYFAATTEIWTMAAQLSFNLRRRGMATPLADLLIATVALENNLTVYSTDAHFERVDGLALHHP